MNVTIIDREDIVGAHKNGMLIKQWERGNATMYTHIAKLDGKFSEIYNLEVTNLDNGQKEYNYANTWRPIVSDLEPIEFLNKYIIPFYHENNCNQMEY
jgi:hypothetical protein